MNRKKTCMTVLAMVIVMIAIGSVSANAAPTVPIPKMNFNIDGATSNGDYVSSIKMLIMLTILTMLPGFIIMMTSFTRIIVSFSFLKGALGAQQSIPNQVLIGLALFLTIFIMAPVYNDINEVAFKPLMEEKITTEKAFEEGAKPLREFMLKQTRQKDLSLFMEIGKMGEEVTKENVPLYVVVPAFAISELKTAFQIGFLIYIPFIVIDMVVASVLMSMGMFMLPPVLISMPFKLLLFVMVDGWYLVVRSLILSFS
ncbi:flagellar type III secretion system pore protein FliP [Clostridium algidicarnis]|uniref:Flagellar biosynthetic protein FliP n=2 Tax=Clostridium algidicarnis TaxID=37659 RepID=A0A2S6G0R0_9CLOT|nr:flagellar type III secretion system pore protein FliP [Clostridium algidicarnis]MBB6630464.1 flagellar type III secretion system pore protein FliP [Clostridium algidicarnis]MBU3193944.1 flagellar type III secretion system pore protein FliP [Clostridium algidicarnis]MBU3195818.1 flagellar type III secretion system pore protein FliP [Clostridium algidicarnis]MBU3202975.1 flagellar type III secretion system pore protein FliP [Clostridium algidicarnis]MBU3208840.1 flagellar type III secretion s